MVMAIYHPNEDSFRATQKDSWIDSGQEAIQKPKLHFLE